MSVVHSAQQRPLPHFTAGEVKVSPGLWAVSLSQPTFSTLPPMEEHKGGWREREEPGQFPVFRYSPGGPSAPLWGRALSTRTNIRTSSTPRLPGLSCSASQAPPARTTSSHLSVSSLPSRQSMKVVPVQWGSQQWRSQPVCEHRSLSFQEFCKPGVKHSHH